MIVYHPCFVNVEEKEERKLSTSSVRICPYGADVKQFQA